MDFDQALDFVNSIEFSDNTKPKVKSKEEVLPIKDNKTGSPEFKLDIKQEVDTAQTVLEQTLDFVSTIEFTENVSLKLEIKEEVKLEIKEETATELQTTDKRTDVWSRKFLIWKINFGLWADAWAGPWEKGVWADSEQLFWVVFSIFHGQKFKKIYFFYIVESALKS